MAQWTCMLAAAAQPNLASEALLRHVQLADDMHADRARYDPSAFASYVLRDEETAQPIQQQPIHDEWHSLASANTRLLIWSHVESGKTQQVSIARVLWAIGRNPQIRVVIVSNTDGQAQKICMTIAKYIEHSPELRKVFPHLQRDKAGTWTKHELTVVRKGAPKDPTVRSCGVHGNILGARIDLLIVDDILDYENTISPTQRQDLWAWFQSTIEGRLTRFSRVICIGTAWHKDDIMHRWARRPEWQAVRYPVIDEHGRLTFPSRWPIERVEEKRSILGSVEFARQMRCIARSDEESRFKEAWIRQCLDRGDGKTFTHGLEFVPDGYRVFTGVDLGVRIRDGSDLTVFFTIIIHPNEDREILEIQSGRWTGPDIVNRIIDVHHRYHSIVMVENVAAQDFILQFTRDRSAAPVRPFSTGANKRHPEFGVESLAVELENAKWIIPSRLGRPIHPEVQAWINEMLYYDPAGHTGDRLMACVTPGQLVTTRRGLVPIEQVVEGDFVLTHKSRFRRVTGVTSRPYEGDIVHVKPSGMHGVLVTPQHPVWSATAKFDRTNSTNRLIPDAWDWRDAGDLRAGRKLDGMYVLSPDPDWGACATRIDLSAFCGIHQLAWGGRWHIGDSELSWRRQKTFPRYLDVDDEMGLLIGLYIAEGSANDHQASFALHRRETHLSDFIARVARERFGCNSSIDLREGHGGMTVRCDSVLMARFFKLLGKRDSKALPWDWMGWPLSVREAIVRGWLLEDGCLPTSNRPRHRLLSGVTVAWQWLEQARLTLQEAGYLVAVEPFPQSGVFQGRPCGQLPAWRLRMPASCTARFLATRSVVELAHWDDVSDQMRERTNSRMLRQDAATSSRLASVERLPYCGPIYNLHVEEDESFVVAGMAVHNSWFAREGSRQKRPKGRVVHLDVLTR